ncbi:MAG: alpha/beta hydrolase [Rubrivivax sp.]|nr:MAG: alpha/beta hydrolase [Rubrivivax sp.]
MRWFKLLASLAAVMALAACAPLQVINALVPDKSHVFTPSVPYGTGPRQHLDVYQPVGTQPPTGWPVVVFFYGGTWHEGDKAQYRFLGEAMAARGVVTMVADYRLYPEASYPDFLVDCAQAVAYALTAAPRYGGDPRRVVVMGHSAGGYNAAMVALDARWLAAQGHRPSELAGWVGLAGPYDFIPIIDPQARETFHHPNVPPDSQPIAHVSAQAPRTFIGLGMTDQEVNPYRNGIQLASLLSAAGVPVVLKQYENVGHITLIGAFSQPLRWLSPVLPDVVDFVQGSAPAAVQSAP